jgi:GTP-binding protein
MRCIKDGATMKFVDQAQIHVKAGNGGHGVVSFRREKYVPKGGPDGGNGGRGGSIVMRASHHLTTLLDFQYRTAYAARSGDNGAGARKTGRSGDDLVIEVPEGTIVRSVANGKVLADLTKHDEECVIARGGNGGRGNSTYATSTDQAPRRADAGETGEELDIELELKLIADVGLVGLPNAGKSTLISVISAARPKIADYPFTTLVPNLGIVRVDEGRSFVVADIPGLIEGAHLGKGLGLQFLRHIQRTRVLVFLLEASRGMLKEDFDVLHNELQRFDPELAKKRAIVAVTKIDTLDNATLKKLRTVKFARREIHYISSVTGAGVRDLVEAMEKALKRSQRSSRIVRSRTAGRK